MNPPWRYSTYAWCKSSLHSPVVSVQVKIQDDRLKLTQQSRGPWRLCAVAEVDKACEPETPDSSSKRFVNRKQVTR